jgi:hypothetical protein
MMSKRNNEPFIAAIDDNDIVGKAAENEAFGSLVARASRHGREGKKTILYNIKTSLNRLKELGSKARSFLLVPSRRCFSLLSSLAKNSYSQVYRRSSFARIRSRNSVRSTSSACPASISPIRRETSRSQASSTPLSRGASRLWIRSWANSARSASESARISERRRCRGSAVMGSPEFATCIILSPAAAPNNGFNRTPVSSGPAKRREFSGGAG